MKKGLALVLAVAMVLAMGMTAFASPSNEAKPTEITITPSTNETNWKSAEDFAKENINAGAKVVALFDVTATGKAGKITLESTAIKAGVKYAILHLGKNGRWEVVEIVAVGEGWITGNFTSLSPVAIVELPGSTTATSPKTGYWG